MVTFRSWLLAGALLSGGAAMAQPEDYRAVDPDSTNPPRLEVVDNNGVETVCKAHGKVCARAGGSSTFDEGRRGAVPAFKRTGTVAAHGQTPTTETSTRPWIIEIDANLKRPAVPGNAVFVFYDLADARHTGERYVTAMYQAAIKAGNTLAARAQLYPEEGFHAGHAYRVQVSQILNNKEILLAQGDFELR